MRHFILAFMLVFFTGCAKYVETNISVFHELKLPLNGVSYAILPSKEQANSLEFQSYANLVKNEFQKQGMVEVPYEQAHFAVYLSYGIDGGKSVLISYPVYGQTGISSSYSTGTVNTVGNKKLFTGTTFNTPTYGIIGSESRREVLFTHFLNIDIEEIGKTANKKVYEGKAVSVGDEATLLPVMPAMIRSVFHDFPGTSGTLRTDKTVLEK